MGRKGKPLSLEVARGFNKSSEFVEVAANLGCSVIVRNYETMLCG